MTHLNCKIFIAVCFLLSAISAHQLNILGAAYGKANVTDIVKAAIQNDSLTIQASNDVFGDSWENNQKSLVIVYQYANYKPSVVVVSEGSNIDITQDEATLEPWDTEESDSSGILGAVFGLADVTQQVQSLVENGTTAVSADNSVFEDSWPGTVKTLVVVYENTQGSSSVEIIPEGGYLDTSVLLYEGLPVLNIIKAAYGLGDVTNVVKGLVAEQGGKRLDLTVSNSLFNDTWPDTQKALIVVYQFGEEDPQLIIKKEEETVQLSFSE